VKSLDSIEADSVVLLDWSVIVYGMSGRIGSARPSSEQAYNLLSRCKLGVVTGVITHQVVTGFAKALTAIALANEGYTSEDAINTAFREGYVQQTTFIDPFARVKALLGSTLRLIAPQNTDFSAAIEVARAGNIRIETALSYAAYERCYGPQCLIATANQDYDAIAGTKLTVFKATDVA